MSRWGWGRRARHARGRSVGTPGNYLVDDREVSRGAAVRPRASRPSPHPQRDTDLCRGSLVSCPVNNGTKSLELPKDRIGGGGPQEGASLTIVVLHELVDLGDELRHARERAAADGALGRVGPRAQIRRRADGRSARSRRSREPGRYPKISSAATVRSCGKVSGPSVAPRDTVATSPYP